MSIKKLIPAILIGTLACVNIAGCTSSKDREATKTKQELKSTQIESNNGELEILLSQCQKFHCREPTQFL